MRIRVSGTFVTKFLEAWEAAEEHSQASRYGWESDSYGRQHRKVEDFLDRMEGELAVVLAERIADAAARMNKNSPPAKISLDNNPAIS